MNEIFNRLSKSKFRSSFHLSEKDILYIDKIGLDNIRNHAYDFVNKKLKIKPINDGKQTAFKGHPVFIAEHATATCCRGCIRKWYGIDENKELSDKEVHFIVNIIMKWIRDEYEKSR